MATLMQFSRSLFLSESPRALVETRRATDFMGVPFRCRCFELCTLPGVDHFMSRRPAYIQAADTPWFKYLWAVYGEPPALPFALFKLNFFYHHGHWWPKDVEWPMAQCTTHGLVDTSTPLCLSKQCSRWYAESTLSPPASSFQRVLFPFGNRSRGTAIFERFRDHDLSNSSIHIQSRHNNSSGHDAAIAAQTRLLHLYNHLLGHATQPHNTWVEVMRMSERDMSSRLYATNGFHLLEGNDSYGCWFYRAIGSGIYLNLGHTWRQVSKDHQLALDHLYKHRAGSSPQKYRPSVVPRSPRQYESFPQRASYLGFHSVQIQFKRATTRAVDPFGEVIVLTAPCMSDNAMGRNKSVTLHACTPFLDLRAGVAMHRCKCSDADSKHSLHCDGVPSSVSSI